MLPGDGETSAADDTLAGVVDHVEGRTFGLRGGDGRTERSVRVAGLHDERASGVRGGEVKADVGVSFVGHAYSLYPPRQPVKHFPARYTFDSKVVAVHAPSNRRRCFV